MQTFIITIEATDAEAKIKQALNEEVKAGYIKNFSIKELDFEQKLLISKEIN